MIASKTHYEQVPLEVIKGIIEQQDGRRIAVAEPAATKKTSDASVSRTGSRQSRGKV